MFRRTRQNTLKKPIYSVAAASVLAVGGTGAVRAQEFNQAFSEFEMEPQEATPSDATIDVAERRYKNAPVEGLAGAEVRPLGTGNASYYGARFAGRLTANGETFDPTKLTAAHRTLPFGSRVKVTNHRNGRTVIVRINDRGPFHGNRVIDLSREAAKQIGMIRQGHGPVELALLAR